MLRNKNYHVKSLCLFQIPTVPNEIAPRPKSIIIIVGSQVPVIGGTPPGEAVVEGEADVEALGEEMKLGLGLTKGEGVVGSDVGVGVGDIDAEGVAACKTDVPLLSMVNERVTI